MSVLYNLGWFGNATARERHHPPLRSLAERGGRWPQTIPTRWHENIVLRACSKTLIFWSNKANFNSIFQVWKSLRTWVVASKHLGTMPSCIILVLSWPVLSDLYSCWTASPNETRRVYCSLEKQTKCMHHFVEWFLLLACTFLLHDVKVLKVHLSCWKHWQKVTTPKSSSNSTLVLFLLTPWIILPAFSPSKPCVFRFGASRQVTGLLYLATETPHADSW